MMKSSTAVLRKRLVFSLLAAGLLPFAGAAWVAHAVATDDAKTAARERVEGQTRGAQAAIDSAVAHARSQATALASDTRVQTALVLQNDRALAAMSAAGARIFSGRIEPPAVPNVRAVVRIGNRPIGTVIVQLPSLEELLDRAQLGAGVDASLRILRDGELVASRGPAPPTDPENVRERPLPALGTGYRLVVVDAANPPGAAAIGTRLGLAAALSIAAIVVLALSLANPLLRGLQVVEEAAAEAEIDPLTGLANRRAFGRTLEHELARSERTGRLCSLVFLDLDDFKLLNDAHGHAVGDDALRQVADVLREQIRSIDMAARLGGEELAVLLPETSTDQAVLVAERLRAAIESIDLRSSDGQRVPVTGSLGVADSTSTSDPEELLRDTDEALYTAKREGKNRVVAASGTAVNAA